MADNVFAYSPVEAVLERQKPRSIFARQEQKMRDKEPGATEAPEATQDGPLSPVDIAAATQVPPNIVSAFQEAVSTQVEDPAAASQVTGQFAQRLGQELQSGKDMREAMTGLLGEDGNAIVDRALALNGAGGAAGAQQGGQVEPQDENTTWSEREGNFFTDAYGGAAGSLGAAARALGSDEWAEYFNEIAQENAPAVASYKDVDNFGEGVRFISGGIAQSLPEMAAVAGAGLATILSGGGALLAGGAVLGSSTLFNTGRAAERQEEENGDVNWGRAWGAGLAMGTLDAIVPGKVSASVSRAFKTRVAGAAADVAQRNSLTREFFANAGTEAVTEVMQNLIEIGQADPDLLRVMVNPEEDEIAKSDELVEEMINSALIGGAAGGTFGAGGAAASRGIEKARGKDNDEGDDPEAAGLQSPIEGPPGAPAQDTGAEPPAGPDAPPAPDMGGDMAPAEPTAPAPSPEAPPAGPLSRSAQQAGPQPEPLAPGLAEGAKVRITTPDGVEIDAEFVEETPGGITLKSESGPLQVTREEIEAGDIAVTARDPIQEKREENQAAAEPDPMDLTGQEAATAAPQVEIGPDGIELPEGVDRDDFEERAAILEEGAGMNRQQAEARALEMILERMDQSARDEAQARIPTAQEMSEQGRVEAPEPAAEIEAAAAETDPEPTPAQAEAENYKTGKAKWSGLTLSIENRKGGERKGTDPSGKEWSVEMPAHYGRILRTEGADGDHVDFYMGDNPDSQDVWVIDQMDAETGRFDEHKTMLGFNEAMQASDAYKAGFNDGKGDARLGGIRKMSADEFKAWLETDTKAPVTPKAKRQDAEAAQGGAAPEPARDTRDQPKGPRVVINEVGADGKTDAERGGPIEQETTTEDGYRIKWDENGTAIFDPNGVGIRSTAKRLTQPEVDEYLSEARKPENAARIAAKVGGKAPAATPEIVTVTDVYGDQHRVRQADLDSDRPMLRRVTAKGETVDGPLLARSNIDTDGAGAAETWKDAPIIGVGRGADKPAKSKRGARMAISKRGQQVEDFDIKEVDGGFIAVRKGAAAQTETESAPTSASDAMQSEANQAPTEIGANEDGNPLYEDDNGIRSYTRNGVRVTESVSIVPGMGYYAPSRARDGEFLNEGEREMMADISAAQKAKKDAPKPDMGPVMAAGLSAAGGDLYSARQTDENTIRTYTARVQWNEKSGEWQVSARRNTQSRDNSITSPPAKDLGKHATAEKALEAMRADGFEAQESTTSPVVEQDQGETEPQAAEPETDRGQTGAKPGPATGILGSLSQEKQDRAAELKKRLADKVRNQTSSGIDPEYITIGGELVSLYIEGGARKFGQMLRDFAETTGLSMREAQAPMRAAYNYVRDEKDLAGEDVSDMDSADAVMTEIRAALAEEDAQSTEAQADTDSAAAADAEPAAAPAASDTRPETARLADYFHGRLSDGAEYSTIVGARKEAQQVLGRDLTEADLKMVEEAMESGVVQAARDIAATDRTDAQKYDAMVDLYQRQPKLAQRTSSSIQYQAYSTPAPMAYLGSRLAGINGRTTVYEPSAGTGMLLMEAAPRNVNANELQPARHELLNRIYAEGDISQGDAMQDVLPERPQDVVIANPPFGKVKDEDGRNMEWPFEGSTGTTGEIDHAISMRALSAMKDDGRAVLIVGGHQGDADARKQGYRAPKRRAFWKKLYDGYNVTEHFTLDGGLYSRQGAGWPVDVVVIEGRGKSAKSLPMKEAPMLYNSWDQLKGRIDGQQDSLDPRGQRSADSGRSDGATDQADDGGGVSRPSGASVQEDGQGGAGGGRRPVGDGAGADGQVGRPDAEQQPGDTGNAGPAVGDASDANAAASVSDQPGAGAGTRSDAEGARSDAVQRPSRSGVSDGVAPAARNKVERNNTEAETDFQVQYAPRSNAQFAVGTLVPKNVADSVGAALDALQARVGDIDNFVAQELGYDVDDMLGTDTKRGYFSAEQVDALALAIDNVGDGLGFIIGDQTGVGKGRIVAGMIRYALKQGKTPVFFTVKPGLYGDMMRDLRDIGMGDVKSEIMVSNNGLRAGQAVPISAEKGDTLASGTNAEQDAWLRTMRQTGALPEGKRILFTTYDQMNTQKGQQTQRMRSMQAIAPNAMFLLDESHEAGGSANAQPQKEGDPEPRSAFIRKLLAESPNGKMFSSATFAKNSTVMSLYTSTNLRNALPSAKKLEEAVERGGVPMQQIISAALVQDGQYVRRERTYEGISMDMDVLSSDPIAAENGAKAVREIFQLDTNFMEGVREAYAEELANEGEGAARDGAIGDAGASSTNFASTMHNVVSQLLLSVKAGEVADRAVDLHKQGKKPIIALSNTNASIIEDYVSDRDLVIGDRANVPFNEILRRYLDRLRRITIKDVDGNKSHYFLTDNDITRLGGTVALDRVRAAEKMIADIDLGELPGSPIDAIRDKMEAAGINVGEITGRGKIIRNGVLETRKGGQAENKRIMNGYNSGEHDALIINRSGATGFSMHATNAPDNDGKTRAMLILQPDNNIDVFMQMLGRINRTGQIKLPEYFIAVSDMAVEKRPAALLMKKLASLNASTTANKKSAVTMEDAPDFMNKYGDRVVRQYLLDNPDVSTATGVRPPRQESASAGLAAKLTGKLIVLGPKRTEEIYADIEQAYQNYIDELDSMGANDLEAKVVEIDAKTESVEVIDQGTAPESAFGRDTVLEKVDAKVIGKPYSLDKLDELVATARDGRSIDAHVDAQTEKLDTLYSDMIEADKERRAELVKRQGQAKTEKQKEKAADMLRRHDTAVQTQQQRLREIKDAVRQFAPGQNMMLSFLQDGQTKETVYATSLGADLSRVSDNPTAASKITVRIALASPGRQVTIPMSRLIGEDANDYSFANAREETVRKAFENGQAETRETREIVTGNVINGFSKFKGRGQIVMFRRNDGTLDQGLLLPKDFSAEDALADAPRVFPDVEQAIRFVNEAGTSNAPALLKTSDDVMTVQRTPEGRGAFEISIDRKRGHKPYIFNQKVRDLLGDFTSRSGPFKKTVSSGDMLRQVLTEYRMSLGAEFQATAHKDEAQAIIDDAKPAPKASRRDPVASLTGKEIKPAGDGMRALRLAGVQWYRKNLIGKKVTNRETGWQIGFTRKGAQKTVNAKGEDLVRLTPALEQLLEQGTLVSTAPDAQGRADMKAVHKFAARVMLDGEPKDVVVTVREDHNGRMHYDLSRDMSVGARFAKKSSAGRGDTLPGPALEGSPDTLNVAVAPGPVKRTAVAPGELRALKARLRSELEGVGLAKRIKLRVADGPVSADYPGMGALDGYFLDSTIGIAADATGTDGALGTLRHEVIHALRDPALWGGSHGLFKADEWRALARAARGTDAKALRDKVDRLYPDLDATARTEEVVAEMFREWAARRDTSTAAGRALAKLESMVRAIVRALSGSGAPTAADVFNRVITGEVGGRGPDGPGGGRAKASRRDPGHPANVEPVYDSNDSRGRAKLASNILTQSMSGSGRANLLALVPGRPLFRELGRNLPAAQTYLRLKEKMDTLRNERHADADKVAQKWRRLIANDKTWRNVVSLAKKPDNPDNARMMDLMHESTIAGQDPSVPYMSVVEGRDADILETNSPNSVAYKAAKARQNREIRRKAEYERLREAFDSLPEGFQEMFKTVRDEYRKMADQFEKAIEEQASKAMTVSVRRAERAHEREIERVRDEGLEGADKDAAIAEADAALKKAKLTTQLSKNARIAQLRSRFEKNRVEGPYFPLQRFGDLYVTSRDEDGKVVSFSRFERVTDQQREAAAMQREGYNVEVGVMSQTNARDMVDPGFVADVEGLLEEISADSMVMDAIWQRWLETLPDMSIRKSRMHRKGTPGYSGDAFRAFGHQMFHGAHQLARLKYSLDMGEALEVAADEARRSDDPVRNGLVVREMESRHEYIMNPQGAWWAQAATSAAFVYYLGMTPAAALVNVSQTSVVGTPILGAFYGKGGIRKASAELMRAMGDFTTGRGHAADGKRLSDDERAAMKEAYDRGIVDKSQSHDLSGVGETGVEYSSGRTMVMEKISWFFHHAERMNREVTFLAAYRMAKSKGLDNESAIQKAGDLTWRTHFDYQNTSRPRLLQNDYMRVAMVFRNFQINMLWRLFRDTHQMMRGKTKADRQEAMAQLAGITGSMMFHAGVKGTWGYALITGLLGLFFSGGSDDVEEAMETALTTYLPKDAAGMILHGAPGHLAGIDLTNRIGMPELWFRKPWRELEGEDAYNYWVQQLLGAVPGIAENTWRGTSMMSDGKWWRGVETMSPKFIRDIMRTGRYWIDGAETYRGDPILDEFTYKELLSQTIGFTPARLSERYDLNSRMKGREKRIMDERKDILAAVRKANREGDGLTTELVNAMTDFERRYPTYPFTAASLRQSIRSGMRASQRNVQGVQLNPRLDNMIRSTTRDPIYE